MKFNHEEYNVEREYKGNKHNKVFLVNYKKTGERFIVKIVQIRDLSVQKKEIEIQNSLDSQYTVKLLQSWRKENYFILLMEYVEQGDLYNLIPKIQTDFYPKMTRLFLRILVGLKYIHSKGIIHRDIKPENILIDKNMKPKIADFGISIKEKQFDGLFGGTVEYMAPEVLFKKQHNNKVDVWACGILLYELFHRRTPFRHKSFDEISQMVRDKTIPFKPDTCPLIIDFVYTTLKINPKDRPSIDSLLHHPLFISCRREEIDSLLSKRNQSLSDVNIPSNRTIECKYIMINPKYVSEEEEEAEPKRLQINVFSKKKTKIKKNHRSNLNYKMERLDQNNSPNHPKIDSKDYSTLKTNIQKYLKHKRAKIKTVVSNKLDWEEKVTGSLKTAIVWDSKA